MIRRLLYISFCLLIPFQIWADQPNSIFSEPENYTQQAIIYPHQMPFASFGIVSAPSSIVGKSVNPIYGHPVFLICPIPKEKTIEKRKSNCVVCFFYGGSQKGIEKKFFEISNILSKSHGTELIRQLWVVRLKESNDKYALILDPTNSKREDVIHIAKELAMAIKTSKKVKTKVRLDKFATPLCSDIINSEIRYQPRSSSNTSPDNKNLAKILDQLDDARYFLQNHVNDQKTDKDTVIIATYDRDNDRLIPITCPKDAKAFKDKKSNLVIVRESGTGVGTMYYVGNAPDSSDAIDTKFSVPAIAFPIKMPGITDKPQHVVNTPFNRDLDTDEMVEYGLKYIREKFDEAFLEVESLNVSSRFIPGKAVHEALPKQTRTLVMTLLLIEHMDYANYWPYLLYQKKKRHRILLGIKKDYAKKLDHLMNSQMRKVLVNLAANEEQSYHYAMSRSGAYGLVQMIKPTYDALLKLYPKAQLIDNFYGGMRHHSNAIMAQFLHLDSELFTLSQAKPLQGIIHPDHIHKKPSLVFDLLIAGYNFSAPRLMNLINRVGSSPKKWKKRLPWETQLYILKANFVKQKLKEKK
jgi:hypothetical protein